MGFAPIEPTHSMRHLPLDGGGWEGVCGAPMKQNKLKPLNLSTPLASEGYSPLKVSGYLT